MCKTFTVRFHPVLSCGIVNLAIKKLLNIINYNNNTKKINTFNYTNKFIYYKCEKYTHIETKPSINNDSFSSIKKNKYKHTLWVIITCGRCGQKHKYYI